MKANPVNRIFFQGAQRRSNDSIFHVVKIKRTPSGISPTDIPSAHLIGVVGGLAIRHLRGFDNGGLLWRATATGVHGAQEKLTELAATSSHEFFAVHLSTHEMTARVNVAATPKKTFPAPL